MKGIPIKTNCVYVNTDFNIFICRSLGINFHYIEFLMHVGSLCTHCDFIISSKAHNVTINMDFNVANIGHSSITMSLLIF